jgi:hypothetical protein
MEMECLARRVNFVMEQRSAVSIRPHLEDRFLRRDTIVKNWAV